jgi:hypothetical protein
MTHNVSSGYIVRKIDQGHPTLLLDEYDTIFSDVSEGSETLRSILNAGYEEGSTYGRVDKSMNPRDYNAFAPVALAGIGNPPDTIADRAVVINMRRKTKAEHVSEFRVRKIRPDAKALRERLTSWAEHAAPVLDLEQAQKVEGISQKVLTAQLRELELDGAVQRKDYGTKRPHVEYSLTPFGEKLRGLVLEMHELALKNCELLKRRPPAGRFARAA